MSENKEQQQILPRELNPAIVNIRPSGIRKFFDIVSEMEDAISLGVGEPDFDTPWHIREEGIHSLEKGRTFYSSNAGLLELREAISDYVAKKHQVQYDPKNEVMVTVGGSEAIDLAMRVILEPGDEVLIPEPCYVSYPLRENGLWYTGAHCLRGKGSVPSDERKAGAGHYRENEDTGPPLSQQSHRRHHGEGRPGRDCAFDFKA